MPIKYTIDIQRKIILETWSGFVTIDEFKQLKKQEFSDPNFKPDYHVLTDLSMSKLDFDENLISEIIQYMLSNPSEIKKRKSAIVADNPAMVAGSFMFEEKSIDLPINIRIFTKIEAALEWIKH